MCVLKKVWNFETWGLYYRTLDYTMHGKRTDLLISECLILSFINTLTLTNALAYYKIRTLGIHIFIVQVPGHP